MKQNSKKNDNLPKIELFPLAMAVYVIFVLAGMLLVYDDFYYNILQTKYLFYSKCTIAMITVLCIYLFFFSHPLKVIEANRGKKLLEIISLTDLMVLLWGLFILLATMFSPVKKAAFSGNQGRYTGCYLLMLYVIAYFSITRYYKPKEWHMVLFLTAGTLMCLFGITDFFDMDLLHFKEEIKETQRFMFTSTIGNINTYTSCVAMVMAFAGIMFASSDNIFKTIGYGLCTIISFIALILGESDNAYLSLAAFFGFLPLYLFRSRHGIKRYLALAASFFTVIKGISIIQEQMAGQVVPLEGLFQVIARNRFLDIAVFFLWALTIASYLLDFTMIRMASKEKKEDQLSLQISSEKKDSLSPWFSRAWLIFILAVIAVAIFVLIDVNIAGNGVRYGGLKNYLFFDDEWGTHRGYIWRIGIEDYQKFPLLQKIFGYGPDTFGIITKANNLPEMVDKYNETFDSAHNEYLQYLITIGPFGLLAYLGIHVGAVIQIIKEKLDNPICVAALFSVLCYAFQALVNINQPIATPVMWTLLAISVTKEQKEA